VLVVPTGVKVWCNEDPETIWVARKPGGTHGPVEGSDPATGVKAPTPSTTRPAATSDVMRNVRGCTRDPLGAWLLLARLGNRDDTEVARGLPAGEPFATSVVGPA
jgi:hypothetical protein